MQEKYSKDVIALASAVVNELTENPKMRQYQNVLPKDNLLTRVCGYIATLPPESQARLLGRTLDEHGEPRIKGNGMTQLADTIGRGFASYNLSGDYTDKEHGKAIYNFTVLQQSKFNEQVVSLGPQIVQGLIQGSGSKNLNYNANLKPKFMGTALDPLSVETMDPKEQDRIVGLTIGMLAKIAGQDTPFKEVLKKSNSLPPELVVAVHEAAVLLAKDPKYSALDKDAAIKIGKEIGKNVRKDVAKYELDNMQLMRKRETIDTEAVKDTIMTIVLGKGSSKSVASSPEKATSSAEMRTDSKRMDGLDELAEHFKKQRTSRSNATSTPESSNSRSESPTVSQRSRRGSFTEELDAERLAKQTSPGTDGKKGRNV